MPKRDSKPSLKVFWFLNVLKEKSQEKLYKLLIVIIFGGWEFWQVQCSVHLLFYIPGDYLSCYTEQVLLIKLQ